MKITKNYWIGILIIVIGLLLLTFVRTDNPCQNSGIGCHSLTEYLLDNIGLLGGICLGMIGLIVLSSGIILEEKK